MLQFDGKKEKWLLYHCSDCTPTILQMTKYNLEDDCVNFLRQYYILKPINCPKRDKQTLRKKNKNKFFRDCQKILVTKDVDGNELKLRCATRISIFIPGHGY